MGTARHAEKICILCSLYRNLKERFYVTKKKSAYARSLYPTGSIHFFLNFIHLYSTYFLLLANCYTHQASHKNLNLFRREFTVVINCSMKFSHICLSIYFYKYAYYYFLYIHTKSVCSCDASHYQTPRGMGIDLTLIK